MNPDLTLMSIFMFILGYLFGFASLAFIAVIKNRKRKRKEGTPELIKEGEAELIKEQRG